MYCKAGAGTLIDSVYIGTGDNVPCRDKIAPYLGKKCFLFWLVIALATEIKPENLGKSRTY